MADDYSSYQVPPAGPCRHAAAVSPSDTADLSAVTRAVYVGGSGNMVVITAGGETVTLTGLVVGTLLPIAVSRVKSTNTTATNLIALW